LTKKNIEKKTNVFKKSAYFGTSKVEGKTVNEYGV
jgi:hypothetical protein